MKRKFVYTYLKPQNYYNRLFTFFVLISFFLTFSLTGLVLNFDLFFLKFFIIFFLIISIGVLIEMFYLGEYISPIEIFEVEIFFNKFLSFKNIDSENFINKYNTITKKRFKKIFKKSSHFFVSSIIKNNGIYIITFMDFKLLTRFYFFKFFIKRYIHKVSIKKTKNSFKIIHVI